MRRTYNKKSRTNRCCTLVVARFRVGFGRTDFSRIFILGLPDFVADLVAGFFLLVFVGKSAQKNPPGKSPAKSSQIYTTKNPRHISAEGPGQHVCPPPIAVRPGFVGHFSAPLSLQRVVKGVFLPCRRR